MLYQCALLYLPEFSLQEIDLIEAETYLNREIIMILSMRLSIYVNPLLGEQ